MTDPQNSTPSLNTLNDLAAQINRAHSQVEQAFTSAMGHALTAGKLLLEAKKQLKHGKFKPWIKANFKFSDRMARAYMRVAEKFPGLPDEERQRVADMSLRGVLKLLATPKDKTSTQSDEPPEQPDNLVIMLAEVGTADLVAELGTRDSGEAEPALLKLLGRWADAAGKEIIIRPKKAAESEPPEQTPTEKINKDLLNIPPGMDRRGAPSGTNRGDGIPSQSRN
jgi:hypothetical protein